MTSQEAVIVIKEQVCKSCLYCVDVCPPEVLKVSDKFNTHGYHPVYYTGNGCTGCGVCFYACPEPGAITVYKKGIHAEV